MYGKRDPNEWEHAIDLLRKSRLNEIEIMHEEEKIYYQLKFSYDSLESTELRNCFLACCLWPEDCRIHKNDLVECWMGLGLLDAFDAPNIYNLGYTLIGKLLSASLLEQDIIIPDRVKMHDIIRDMAVWLAHDFGKERNKWIMRTGAGVDQVLHEKDRWCHAERATLYVEEQTLANQPIPCQANKLLFLAVHYYKYDGTTAGTLVKHLKFFCTLTFLDLSRCKLISVPQGISSLVNLRHLDLSYNKINSVPEELKFCRNLRYLFLGDNCIASFPMGVISELKMLLVLNLFRIDGAKDQEIFPIDPNIIHGEKKWEFLDWLIKEIKCLDNIRSLGITLKHGTHFESILELPNLPIRFLELDFVNEIDTLLIPGSFIGDSRIQDNLYILHLRVKSARRIVIECQYESTHCHLKCLEFLRLSGMEMLEEIIWQNLVPHDLFLRLYILRIEYCRNLKDVSWTLYLPCLTSFGIHSCDSIIRLFEHFGLASAAEERAVTPTFPSLKQLSLSGLPKLQIICEQSIMFPCLEYIGIRCCPMLKKLPFQSNTAISKLRAIHTETDCWERLEWEDHEIKQSLQPFMKFDDFS
ncbi:LRR and NB-ARC domains-containing disease resistance protein [Rhynchospora pubera]|uniref:LRR and NB-ARC domains-containing disease resistance protein n=1 Tax=Rhynchospora pubera TaxID=906938 RepID=A0AAV8CGF7_9POAL|nr:LRR and NB-ARC domains-containing disease resistance protein [Rhynchospora pubera]